MGRISLDSNEVWALVTESSVGGRGSTEAPKGELYMMFNTRDRFNFCTW